MLTFYRSTLMLSTALLGASLVPSFAQSTGATSGTTVLSPIVVQTPSEPAPKPAPAAQQAQTPSAPANASAPQAAPAPTPAITQFDALSTSSSKARETLYDAPATVTVKSAAEIDRQAATTTRQLVADQPGISVGNQPNRGGASNYVIRGIGENRVRIEIDGVKVPDFPVSNIGSPTGYTRDFVDLDSLKRVEIVRGPASALYGSDALGGVVSYVTKDPADYLALFGKNTFMSAKAGVDTMDRSVFSTLTGAARTGAFDEMLVVTRRFGHEIKPNGSIAPNPQDYNTTNVLGKIVWNAPNQAKLTVTGEYFAKGISTDVQSDLGAGQPFGTGLASFAQDTNHRGRLSAEWTSPVRWQFADGIKLKAFGTEVNRTEDQELLRLSGGTQRYRTSAFSYDQAIFGGEMQFNLTRKFFGATHDIIYGFTADSTDTTRPRYREERNLSTNVTTYNVGGEFFPNKNFPDTTTTQAAAYWQDTAQWGALRVIPALRFDFYNLKPHPDQMFANANIGNAPITDQTATALSPKLGATYDLNSSLRLFGQYAHGFRAPPYDNANFGFRNTQSFYEILPNVLKPETSDGLEFGIRGKSAAGSSFQLSGYYNKYKNFIDTVVTCYSPSFACGSGGGLIESFQYQNIPDARIFGYEAKGEYKFLPTWSLFGSIAYANGLNETNRTYIASVDPWTLIGGLRYQNSVSGWGGELRAKYVARKDQVNPINDITSGSVTSGFVVPAHTTVDALVSYEIAPSFTFNAGVFNIFNASYYNPIDVAGFGATDKTLERYKAPGRSLGSNVTFRW